MKRRQALFGIFGIGVGLAAASRLSAQTGAKSVVIGLLDAGDRKEWWAAFRQQMREFGYVEGQNITYEMRVAAGRIELLPTMAQELVRLNVSAIVTSGTAAAQAAKQITSTTPIVMATGADQVSLGLVDSLARPGGNVTGVTSLMTALTNKRLELLREIFPKISRLAVLWQSSNGSSAAAIRDLETAASPLKISLQNLRVNSAKDCVDVFAAAVRERAEVLFVVHAPLPYNERRTITQLALKHRLPSIYGAAEYVDAGGLISYGTSYPELFRHAAAYLNRILKGAKPGDLPIEQPTTYELIVNRKTAKALGVVIPQAVLLRAERVIE